MINYKKLIYIIIFMISFFNTGNAKYNKIFFDFED
jgi:glutathione peroxidase